MRTVRMVIICPAPRQFRVDKGNGRPSWQMKIFRFSMLSALQVAAAAPEFVRTRIVDENVEPVDIDSIERNADIVGLSFMTFNAPRAYRISEQLRARGKTVVFGGYHPTLNPQEAKQHCDSVCVGEAEGNVERMLEDFRSDRLQEFYSTPRERFSSLPAKDDLLDRREYIISSVIQATRGCTNACGFCSVSAFFNRTHKAKPVSEVIEEIRRLPGRNVLFIDDNLAADSEYAKQLFRAMVPCNKRWYSQIGIGVADDPEMLRLMKESGCRGVFIGLESVSQKSLEGMNKGFNRAENYREAIGRLHRHGIGVVGAFVLGFDNDTPEVFEATARFLREAGVDALQLTNMTPFPGTKLFEDLDRQGRILDRNWEHYDMGHVVYSPRHVTPDELQAAHARILGGFYSWPAIVRRLVRQTRYLRPQELFLSLAISLGYRYKLKKLGYM